MGEILDNISFIFWSIAYVLIIYNGIRNNDKDNYVAPLFTCAVCIAWEFASVVYSKGLWGHWAWFILDIVILVLNLRALYKKTKVVYLLYVYLAFVIALCIVMKWVFNIGSGRGMLISSFILDIAIPIEYITTVKFLNPSKRILIAICRLVGDAAAWFGYMNTSLLVKIIGPVVFMLHIFYMCYVIEIGNRENRYKRRNSKKVINSKRRKT